MTASADSSRCHTSRCDAVTGKGSWTKWRGGAALNLSNRPAARLALGVDAGRYRLQGKVAAAQFLTGRLQRLTAPVVTVAAEGTFKDRLLDGQLTAASPALHAVARGGVDLAQSRFTNLRLGIDVMKPQALYPTMSGEKVRLVWTLDGAFGTADYSYRLTSKYVKIDANSFIALRAEGRGRRLLDLRDKIARSLPEVGSPTVQLVQGRRVETEQLDRLRIGCRLPHGNAASQHIGGDGSRGQGGPPSLWSELLGSDERRPELQTKVVRHGESSLIT